MRRVRRAGLARRELADGTRRGRRRRMRNIVLVAALVAASGCVSSVSGHERALFYSAGSGMSKTTYG